MIKATRTNISSTAGPATEALCEDLHQVLHAASQPLTILRASLCVPDLRTKSTPEMRRLLKRSSQQVERLCLLFSYLQQLVVIGSAEAREEIENVPLLLVHTVEGVDLLFAEAGVVLTLKHTEDAAPFVLLDSSRFEHAISTLLLAALSMAVRGDEVFLGSSSPGAFVQIDIRSALKTAMASETRLSMALAAANLRSQGAELTWQELPFTVQIVLPSMKSPVVT